MLGMGAYISGFFNKKDIMKRFGFSRLLKCGMMLRNL